MEEKKYKLLNSFLLKRYSPESIFQEYCNTVHAQLIKSSFQQTQTYIQTLIEICKYSIKTLLIYSKLVLPTLQDTPAERARTPAARQAMSWRSHRRACSHL